MSPTLYIIIAVVVIALAIAARLLRIRAKNRWKGLNDFGTACVDTEEKICSLTFDDGPHPVHTPAILDTLKRHGVRATFFVLGKQARQYPGIIRRMAEEGHDIGNHTTTHARLSHSSAYRTIREIELTQQIIQSITGKAPVMIRPPHGRFSREQEQIVREHFRFPEHYAITWDICTYDWEVPSRECLLHIVREETRPGSILLFHDVHPSTADNLDAVLDHLREEGYQTLPVSELLQKGTPIQMRE